MNKYIITNLSEKEIAVLRAFGGNDDFSVMEISERSGIKRTTVYNFIAKLVDRGYLETIRRNGYARYRLNTSCPEILVDKSEADDDQKYRNFQLLSTRYAIRKAISETLKSSNKRVDWLVGSPDTTDYLGSKFIERYIEQAFEIGVEVRTLRSPMTVPAHKYGSDEAVRRTGRNLRRAQSNLPFKTTFTIHDDILTFISSDRGGVGYIIHDQEMADSFRFIFNGLWKYAKVIGEEKYI